MVFVRILGSLYLAIFLIASLAVILTVSTILESVHGTPFAQKFFYRAGWFDLFLALFGVNIFCSTLLRFPFKKHHTGFVITHVGILMLLSGALLTRFLGVEGQMALYEGEHQDSILQEGYELIVHQVNDQRTKVVELKPYADKTPWPLNIPGGAKLSIHRVLENAEESMKIKDGAAADPLNHAIQFTLQSERAGFRQTLWLVEKNPFNPHANALPLGPALIQLKEKKPTLASSSNALPAGRQAFIEGQSNLGPRLKISSTKKDFWIDLPPPAEKEIPLGETGLRVSNLNYYPNARVEDNKLVSISGEPLNPAVQFEIHDNQGRREKHTLFALFPEFESLHGRDAERSFDLSVELVVPNLTSSAELSRPGLTFYPGERWTFESKSSRGSAQGELVENQTYSAGWMDFNFRVEKLLDRAVVSKKVTEAKEADRGSVGVEISVPRKDGTPETRWVFPEKPAKLQTPSGEIILAVGQKSAKVPFVLGLKDFRKVDYPGTQNPASYESDVILHDHEENVTIEKTIKMNKPLDYKGFRIFQSSYAQDPDLGEASVFTVAKNPGIVLIYSGACVILTGVILLFYLHPLFNGGAKSEAA